jgi:hypothetical protein
VVVAIIVAATGLVAFRINISNKNRVVQIKYALVNLLAWPSENFRSSPRSEGAILRTGKQVFERLNNLRWEAQLGISTTGIVDVDKPDSCYYATINYFIVHRVLEHLPL